MAGLPPSGAAIRLILLSCGGLLKMKRSGTIQKQKRFIETVLLLLLMDAIFPGCEQQTDPRDLGDNTGTGEPLESLIETTWRWDAGGYGIRTLSFISDGVVQFQDQFDGDWYDYDYSYIPGTKKGVIGTALDKSNSIESPFTVNSDNTQLIFTRWKSYPHGADYLRLEE
jgi:hypothetical protein